MVEKMGQVSRHLTSEWLKRGLAEMAEGVGEANGGVWICFD
jgi:hypothetical protein